MSRNSKLQAVLKICCDFGKGAQCAPDLDELNKTCCLGMAIEGLGEPTLCTVETVAEFKEGVVERSL